MQTRMVVSVVLAMVCSARAYGHGDAWWIQQNRAYIGIDGSHCCGERDCEPVDPRKVKELDNGWRNDITSEFIHKDRKGVYQSVDEQYWVCRFMEGEYKGHIRCWFYPINKF